MITMAKRLMAAQLAISSLDEAPPHLGYPLQKTAHNYTPSSTNSTRRNGEIPAQSGSLKLHAGLLLHLCCMAAIVLGLSGYRMPLQLPAGTHITLNAQSAT